MKISGLKDKVAVDEIILKITAKEETRDVRGGALKLCNLTGQDDTGTVTITLWNQDIDKVNEGDTIKITKGWSQIYKDNMQLSVGRFGKLEIIKE